MNFSKFLTTNISALGLIISFASLILSFIAFNSITKVQGFEDLLIKTGQNSEKLETLVLELKEQNVLQQEEIEDNIIEQTELKRQTKMLTELFNSNHHQLLILKKEEKSNSIGDFVLLESLCDKLHPFLSISDKKSFTNLYYKDQTLEYLRDLKALIQIGLENKLLKTNEKAFSQWWIFYSQIQTTIIQLDSNENLMIKYFNANVSHNITQSGEKISKEELEFIFLNDFRRYANTFYEKGLKEGLYQMKEFKQSRRKFLELSNYGRAN